MSDLNYLEKELNDLFQSDLSMWHFLRESSLDGVWYWDLENPENEWMSPEFWRTFGIDPATKDHKANEWQDMIWKEDLALALDNFEAHCANPDHPYDQIVRYRHADGSIVWIRCRGLAIRDKTGKPVRLLGAHTDITAEKLSEAEAMAGWRAANLADRSLKYVASSIQKNILLPYQDATEKLRSLASSDQVQADSALRDQITEIVGMLEKSTDMVDELQHLNEIALAPSKMETVDLDQVFLELVDEMQDQLSDMGADLDIGELGSVVAIRSQIKDLFRILLVNALDARTKENSPLIIVSRTERTKDGRAEITVSDNGLPISYRTDRDIFSTFELRQPKAIKARHQLSPTICERIAHNHNTEVTARTFGRQRVGFSIFLDHA